MLKQEFETLAGTTVTSQQYRVIEDIYRDFPEITDTKGKEQIVEMYKTRGMNGMYTLWKELNPGKFAIAYSDQDTTDNYDVDFDGYIKNVSPKLIGTVFSELQSHLATKYPAYNDLLDYFHAFHAGDSSGNELPNKSLFPKYHCVICYFIAGSSEGWYLHIESVYENDHRLLYLAKSFDRDVMLVLVDEISQYFGN